MRWLLPTPELGFVLCIAGLILLLPALAESLQVTVLALAGGFLLGFGAKVLVTTTEEKER